LYFLAGCFKEVIFDMFPQIGRIQNDAVFGQFVLFASISLNGNSAFGNVLGFSAFFVVMVGKVWECNK
jgi:hypothetical protein